MKRIIFKAVAGGWLLAFATNSLIQDAVGKEEYLRLAQEGWLPGNVTVPLALLLVISTVGFIRSVYKHGKRKSDEIL